MEMKFESQTFGKRLMSMLKVDFRRLFTMKLFYIMLGVALVIPILVLVMTTMMDGTTITTPETGVGTTIPSIPGTTVHTTIPSATTNTSGQVTTIEGFDNVWQIIGSVSGESASMSMDLTSMCNINMLYFIVAVLICMFVAADFRSGYSKILFAGRSKKGEYIISKTLIGFVGGAFMIIAWVVGAMLGGAMSGLSFDLGVAGINGLIMCIIAKIFLMAVFASIFVLMSVIAKDKLWMSIVGSLMIGMLFFMMIPMLTPLDSTISNVFMCLVGGLLFSIGIGTVSKQILRKKDLV